MDTTTGTNWNTISIFWKSQRLGRTDQQTDEDVCDLTRVCGDEEACTQPDRVVRVAATGWSANQCLKETESKLDQLQEETSAEKSTDWNASQKSQMFSEIRT